MTVEVKCESFFNFFKDEDPKEKDPAKVVEKLNEEKEDGDVLDEEEDLMQE